MTCEPPGDREVRRAVAEAAAAVAEDVAVEAEDVVVVAVVAGRDEIHS